MHSTYELLSGPDFFFSSRRRHTRCLSDWSSDVCSSDLHGTAEQISKLELELGDLFGRSVDLRTLGDLSRYFRNEVASRSEERRVGKSVDLGGRRIMKKNNNEGARRAYAHKPDDMRSVRM